MPTVCLYTCYKKNMLKVSFDSREMPNDTRHLERDISAWAELNNIKLDLFLRCWTYAYTGSKFELDYTIVNASKESLTQMILKWG